MLSLAESILERDERLLGHAYRQMLEAHLAEAERHVTQGERHVSEQRQRIATLERDGHDTAEATGILEQFGDTQALHVAHRDRLRKQLSRD